MPSNKKNISKAGAIGNLKPVQTKEEARERGRQGGIKSGEVRRERKRLKELGYTGIESFDKLNELQEEALKNGCFNAALKAEELKGKLAGLYVEKMAQTDSEGNDLKEPIVFNINPVKVIKDT